MWYLDILNLIYELILFIHHIPSRYIIKGISNLPSALYIGRRYLDAFLSSMIVTIGVALSNWMSLVPSVNWNSQKNDLKPKPTSQWVRVQSGMAFYIELMCHVLGWFFWPRPMRHSMQLSCNWEGVPSNECSNQWDIYCSGKWRLNVSRTRFISECDDVLCLEVLFDPYERLSTDIRYQHQPQSHTNDATQGSHVNSLRIFNFSFSLVRFNGTMCLGHHRQWHGLNIFEYDGLRTLNY